MGARYNRLGKGLALPMKVISLLAQKGGTGKSTLAAHLAIEAVRTGPRPVVLLDLDPQAYKEDPLAPPNQRCFEFCPMPKTP